MSISHLFEFTWRLFSYEFTSVYKYFLIFLEVCGPAFSKGICSAFVVHVNLCCGAVCCVCSELLSDIWEGRSMVFGTCVSKPSRLNWGVKRHLMPYYSFHEVWSAAHLSDSMLKGNDVLCDWCIRNSFPITELWVSLSKRQKLVFFVLLLYIFNRMQRVCLLLKSFDNTYKRYFIFSGWAKLGTCTNFIVLECWSMKK